MQICRYERGKNSFSYFFFDQISSAWYKFVQPGLRMIRAEQVSERAGIGRTTLWAIEKGSPLVALGFYAQVLFVLGLEKDLVMVAGDDPLGRKLQDAKLTVKKRAPKKSIN